MTIVLYDISSTRPGRAWNPTTWKARFCLNYKGIPYRTEWVEYPDIAENNKKLGLSPTGKTLWDGTDYYTLPAIHDTETGAMIGDSWEIAVYLDKQYPDAPTLIPHDTHGLQAAFTDAHSDSVASLWAFFIPAMAKNFYIPRTEEYFLQTREMAFGITLDELLPKGERAVAEWDKFKAGLGKIDSWYAKADSKGPFLLGDTISWADLAVSSYTICFKIVWGEDSEQWKDIASWHGGRWNNLLLALDKYTTII